MPRRSVTALGTLPGAVLLVVAPELPAGAAGSITLTWVRHAQSTANAGNDRPPAVGSRKAARTHCSTGGDA
jgi:hypothetical protein